MITNERQHRITRAEARRFEDAIERAEKQGPDADVHPRLHQAMIDGLRSQLDELHEELGQYEALRQGKIKRRVSTSLLDLPTALIEARIARRLTQKELGKKLGLPEQQIQRYEGTRYAGASIERLQEVADALGIKIKKTIEFDVPGMTGSRGRPTTAARSSSKRRITRATAGSGETEASSAARTLASRTASKSEKKAAASALARIGSRKRSKKAMRAAG